MPPASSRSRAAALALDYYLPSALPSRARLRQSKQISVKLMFRDFTDQHPSQPAPRGRRPPSDRRQAAVLAAARKRSRIRSGIARGWCLNGPSQRAIIARFLGYALTIRVAKIVYQRGNQVAAGDRVRLGPVAHEVGLHREVDDLGELAAGEKPNALGSKFSAQSGEKLFAGRVSRYPFFPDRDLDCATHCIKRCREAGQLALSLLGA